MKSKPKNVKRQNMAGLIETFNTLSLRAKIGLFFLFLFQALAIIGVVASNYFPYSFGYSGHSLPERCTFPVPVNCAGYAVTENSIQLMLINGAGRGIYVENITARSEAFRPVNGSDSNHNCSLAFSERNQVLRNGEEKLYTLNVSTEPGSKCSYYDVGRSKNRYSIEMYYSFEDAGDITHIIRGELFASLSSNHVQDSAGTGLVDSISPAFIIAFVIVLEVIVVIFFGVAVVSPILIIFWLALSIYLIATGRPNKEGVNAKRNMGIWLIVGPIILVAGVILLTALLGYPSYHYVILLALLITMTLTFVGVVYAVNNRAKFALIPLVIIAIVLPALALASLLGVY